MSTRRCSAWGLLGISICTGLSSGVSAESRSRAGDEENLERLSVHLTQVEEQARKQRYISGGVLLGLGVVAGGAALVTASMPTVDRAAPIGLGIAGGALGLVGTLILALPTDFEELPQRYHALPEGNSDQVRKKLAVGESYLSTLASRAKTERLVSGGLLLALGAGDLIWYATLEDRTNRNSLAYSGALVAGVGLVLLFVQQPAESQYDDYRHWRRGGEASRLHPQLVAFPLVGGAGVGFQGQM